MKAARFYAMRQDDRETAVKGRITELLQKLGFKTWSLSQGRKTRQTPGLPDLFAKHPARGLSFSQETKTEDGRVSEEQQGFSDACRQCGDLHVVGGYEATVKFLQEQKFIAPGYTP